jgi:signal transduction histidine kinase
VTGRVEEVASGDPALRELLDLSLKSANEQWYSVGTALAREIVAGQHLDALHRVVERVAEIADADSVSILQHGSAENTLVVAAAVGNGAARWAGSVLNVPDSICLEVMATGRPRQVERVLDTALPDARTILGVDSVIVVPLTGSSGQRGVLVIGRNPGRPRLTPAEMGMATMLAGNVALALELAESLARRDQLALIGERDRIARDLHDHVIQRLYAIGLTMQHVGRALPPEIEQRLTTSVDEIDETIKQIRSTIYRLTVPIMSAQASLRGRAEDILDDLEPVLDFRPRLVSDGPVDFGVDESVVDDCTAVLREALTNVARHACATQAEVALSVANHQLRLEVRDNGRGLGEATRRSGLANLRARAEARGGFMQLRSSAADGTWLLWSVPVDSDE